MANKNKANDAILMAILQDIQGNNTTSTSAMLQADIKRDGADKQDIQRNVANETFDLNGDLMSKIMYTFQQHPGIVEELDRFADENGLMQEESNDYISELANLITLYLEKERKYAEGGQFEFENNTVDVDINGKTYTLLHFVTEEEKELGLQNVIEMESNEGALFDYSDEPQEEISFWMKDTTIPLLICFINEDGEVISVHKGEPLSEEPITESSEFVAYVIEVNVDENIKEGDQTSLGQEDNYPDVEVNRLYIYGSDGNVQATLQGGERIFSRKSSKVIIKKAKKAYMSKEDKDYKALGRYVFKEMKAQDERPAEYVNK